MANKFNRLRALRALPPLGTVTRTSVSLCGRYRPVANDPYVSTDEPSQSDRHTTVILSTTSCLCLELASDGSISRINAPISRCRRDAVFFRGPVQGSKVTGHRGLNTEDGAMGGLGGGRGGCGKVPGLLGGRDGGGGAEMDWPNWMLVAADAAS